METGFGAEIAPGFLAGWSGAEAGVEVTQKVAAAITKWPHPRGNHAGQNWSTDPRTGIWVKAHSALPAEESNVRHIGLWVIPTNQEKWRTQEPSIFNVQIAGTNLFMATFGGFPHPFVGLNQCLITDDWLWADFNVLDDRNNLALEFENLNASPKHEDAWIQALIDRQKNYIARQNLNLHYECVPSAGQSNASSSATIKRLRQSLKINST